MPGKLWVVDSTERVVAVLHQYRSGRLAGPGGVVSGTVAGPELPEPGQWEVAISPLAKGKPECKGEGEGEGEGPAEGEGQAEGKGNGNGKRKAKEQKAKAAATRVGTCACATRAPTMLCK